MINIGVIGCGKIAEKHMSGYRHLKNVNVTMSDTDLSKKEVAAKQGAAWSSNPNLILQSDNIDVIDVCTPTTSHFDLITQALTHGKHVICEKPFVIDPDEAIAVKKLAKEQQRKIFVAYPFRFSPAFNKVAEILARGIIGDPYFSMLRLGGRGSHQPWKHQKSNSGGAINEMLVHVLDIVLWFFGEMETSEKLVKDTILKSRQIGGAQHQVDAEDFVLLKLLSKKNVEIICESDLITPSYMNTIEIHGTNGSIFTSIMDKFPTTVFCHEASAEFGAGETKLEFNQVNLFKEELSYFIDCIANDKEPETNGIDDSITIAQLIKDTF